MGDHAEDEFKNLEIYNRNESCDSDVWDDTALIAAYETAMGRNSRKKKRKSKSSKNSAKRVQKSVTEDCSTTFTEDPNVCNEAHQDVPFNNCEDKEQHDNTNFEKTQNAVPPPIPPDLMTPHNGDLLNNLLISWYMAGYYAGLYQSSRQ